jgi:Holliday junction DNA helicase RuvA
VIAFVSGELAWRSDEEIVILTSGGVGYRLAVSAQTLAGLPAVGGEVALQAHLVGRDDGISLYGFGSEAERELFTMLLGVQGVGPKVALAVLGGGSTRELTAALATGDRARLQAVPGVGKRTAERIVMELKEKVGGLEGAGDEIRVSRGSDPRIIARDGLVELGFTMQEADTLTGEAGGESAEEILQNALKAAKR